MALTWVQNHIHSFDADPSNVTIFGSSSGAGCVSALLAMPDSMTATEKGPLFHAAILSSGSFSGWVS